MNDQITVIGRVATDPNHLKTATGLDVTSFRMASSQRKYDRKENKWVDLDPNWFTISSFRDLALHTASSLAKGQPVVVTGKLKIRPWTMQDGRTGTTIEIVADAIGHDLRWGTSSYAGTPKQDAAAVEAPEPADPEAGIAEAFVTSAPDDETPF